MHPHNSARKNAVRFASSSFRCRQCGNCCRIPGEVKLREASVKEIAAFLNIPDHQFIEQYTRLNQARNGLSLIDGKDDNCVFLTRTGECSINPVKPEQCRDFPWGWNYPGFEKICRAARLA